MKIDDIGEVIASRILFLTGPEGPREVRVSVGKPKPYVDGKDNYCPYSIRGLGAENLGYASGIDSIQALELALKKIGTILYSSDAARSGNLRWEGDEEGDLGFPVPTGGSLQGGAKNKGR